MNDTKKVILALDSGSQSSRVGVYSADSIDFQCLYRTRKYQIKLDRPPGYNGLKVLSPVQSIIESVILAMNDAADKMIELNLEPKAIGITNQRETFIAWEEEEGCLSTRQDRLPNLSVYPNAVSWQSAHQNISSDEFMPFDKLKKYLYSKTGLPHSFYPSCTKIRDFIATEVNQRNNASIDYLRFGTVDTIILRYLTGEYKTDVTNAHRTGLICLNDLHCWDGELLNIWGIPRHTLPKDILPSSSDAYGVIFHEEGHELFNNEIGLPALNKMFMGLKVSAMIGDQQASALAHGLTMNESIKITLGTGAFLCTRVLNYKQALNYGVSIQEPMEDQERMQVTPLIQFQDFRPMYMGENYVKSAGVGIAILNRIGLFDHNGSQSFDQTASATNLEDPSLLQEMMNSAPEYINDIVDRVYRGDYEPLLNNSEDITMKNKVLICRCYVRKVVEKISRNCKVFQEYFAYERNHESPTGSLEKRKANDGDEGVYVDGGLINSIVFREELTRFILKDHAFIQFRKDPEMTVLGAVIAAAVGSKEWSLEDMNKTITKLMEHINAN